ncbi:MAG: glycosyltransferase family 4 protein [Anaerolineae bacterium]|nr:glycosyltransferase family 4 protein [Anaerolineae bacterium]
MGRARELRTDQRLWWQQIALPRRVRAARTNILHVPGFDAPRWKPCPVVLTVHDLIGMLFPQNLPPVARFYWSRWLPLSVRWADRIIADSEHTRHDICRLMGIPHDRIAVIPLGVGPEFHPIDDPRLLDSTRTQYGLPDRFILYLGTLEPRKGIDTLIRSYGQMASDVEHDLVVAGKRGWYTEPLFALVRELELEGRVHFAGYVPDALLPALLSLADLFVFPSRYEGFGLPPLEAMACGTPVITSNASSLPEVVGGAGMMVPPDDVPALSAALSQALESCSLRDELINKGLARASQFTWEATAQRTLEVYQDLIA